MLANLPHVVPPKAHEIEVRTLAALIHLGDPKNLLAQVSMLKLDKECFADQDTRTVFELILSLFNKGNSFDFVEVLAIIPSEHYNLVNLAVSEHYSGSRHLASDVERLIEYRTYRKQLRVLVNTVNSSFEHAFPGDAINCIHQELQSLSNLASTANNSIVRSYESEIDEYLSLEDEDNAEFQVNIPGLPKVPNRSLITIAGRSGHGKTFFALCLMDAIIDAKPGKQTLYFNLEMHPHVMIERHAILLGAKGATRKEVISNGATKLLEKNVSLVSVPMITIEQIEAESRLASLRQPLCCIVVDYLGLVGSKSKHDAKYLQQNDIAKRLAALSLELDCVVIALIQVNRDFKTKPVGDRCPQTSDASESMGSVHSSSWWIGIDQPQNDDKSGDYQDLFMVACRKNRGDSGLFNLNLKFKNGMFSKYERPFSANRPRMDGF